MTTPTPPRRPDEVPADATLAELVDAYARHLLALAAARAGSRRLPADQLAAHAVAALALGQAITTDLHDERTPIMRDALAYGAGLGQVVAVVQPPADVVAAGLREGGGSAAAGDVPVSVPLVREPLSVWPPFAVRDDRFDHLRTTDPNGWRRAVRADRVAALLEPLAGVELSERERAVLEWLAGWDVPTIAPLVRVLHAARAAAPRSAGGAG